MAQGHHHQLVADTPVGGRYRVRRMIGRWKVGTAYDVSAPDTPSVRTLIALDVQPGQTARYLRWVQREAQRNGPLPADLLLPIDGGHIAGEAVYMVLGPFRGRSMSQAVKKLGPFGERRVAEVGHRLARLVGAAHDGGAYLGSLRPTTVLLDPEGDDPDRPVIFDMGLSRGLADLLVNPPRPARGYWAPDRPRDARPTSADDIFGVGALLYHLLTADRPPKVDPEGVKVVTPPSWKRTDAELAAYLDPVVLRAMASRARDRYPDAHQLAEALAALSEVFGLSPAAREMLGLPSRDGGFRREPTSPHLLHDYLGLPPEHPTIDGIPELDLDPEDD